MKKTRRWMLLALVAALSLGTLSQTAVADDVDFDCALIAANACAAEGGCRLYQRIGCTCKWVCESGVQGYQTCGGGNSD